MKGYLHIFCPGGSMKSTAVENDHRLGDPNQGEITSLVAV